MKKLNMFFFARTLLSVLLLALTIAPNFVFAVEQPGSELQKVGVDKDRLGKTVDMNLSFTDSSGAEIRLRDLVASGRPLIITPVYYRCPRLCGFFLSGFIELLNNLTLSLGSDFNIATVSFDPEEDAQAALKQEQSFKALYKAKQPGSLAGWHFLVGKPETVTALMQQIGFKYFKDGPEYAHTAAFMILTPSGEISQYFTGIEFPAWDVRLALVEAAKGAIGSAIDHVLLFCFRFDPTKGKYTWAAFNFMRVGVILCVLSIAAMAFWAVRR
jgi:protein SCO1/2